ncbi:MAG: DMT family transporter [Candidatus Fermentibacteraceae bacterium]
MSTGILAALGTAVCWAACSFTFEVAGKRIGSYSVTVIRLFLGFLMLIPVSWVLNGTFFPGEVPARNLMLLAISGLVGFVFADLCLFSAFVRISARITMVIYTTVPLMTGLLGWAFLGETLSLQQWGGILLTSLGVAFVLTQGSVRDRGWVLTGTGFTLALLGSLGQAAGLVIGKAGLSGVSSIGATQIRVAAAALAFIPVTLIMRRTARIVEGVRNGRAMKFLTLGTVAGPVVGVTLSMTAVRLIPAGVAATLISMTPIFLMIPSALFAGHRLTIRDAVGTAVAVLGGILVAG